MDKGIKNTEIVVCKLETFLTRANNYRLEVASEKRQKKEETMERGGKKLWL